MALLINNYTTVYGVKATHWVIDVININDKYNYAEITVFGYKSERAYRDGSAPLETRKVKINWNDGYGSIFSKKTLMRDNRDIFSIAYEYVKTHVDIFKESIDV